MKALKVVGIIILLLMIAFFLGPKAQFDPVVDRHINPINITLDSLDRYVKSKEINLPYFKPGNESRLIWVNDSIQKTRYSIVYLHGFSASPMESNPTMFDLAKELGFNLYAPLLAGHGLDDRESFVDLQPNDLINDAKEAIAIGQLLGEDVIVMSCSTGATLSIYLAGANKELIDIMVMYSPNIALADPTAKLVTGHWGTQIVQSIIGDYWNPTGEGEGDGLKYWTTTYRSNGLIALQKLINYTMDEEIFEEVTQPYFLGYYYKNDEERDPTVSTDAMLWFDANTSTSSGDKKVIAFPGAEAHVITNPIKSKSVEAVLDSTLAFVRKEIGE
ncbi:MAG: esterase [Flammeovirgaceae bacterium]|nr:esterase [Flammeovirgaceae bacterium]MBR08550.1 esterase [Rickettsiales bacterium]HCX22994.1 alpha/beta hydrolase [Cytophagales bacterium]